MTIFVYIIIFCLVFGLKNWTFFCHFTKYYYLCTQNLNKMTTSSIIRNKVAEMPTDVVFTYQDFGLPTENNGSVLKTLNRMAASGEICKLSKGKFYKTRKTVFGELKPRPEEIVKDLLEKDGKPIGYLTGLSIFNGLGLTTQVASIIQIGTNTKTNPKQRGPYTIKFVVQPNPIERSNIELLQLLDCIRMIKDIPDSSTAQSCSLLMLKIKDLTIEERQMMTQLAIKYSPSTRALLGAIMESIEESESADKLFSSLNNLTTFNIGISETILPNKKRWRII